MNFNQFRSIEIISSIFSEYNGMKFEVNPREKNTLLKKTQWVNEEVKKKLKKYLETKDNEIMTIQNLWDDTKAVIKGK